MDNLDDDDPVDGEVARVENLNAVELRSQITVGGCSATIDNNRKVPFPSMNTEGDGNNGFQMMKETKKFGWDNSLKFGKRSICLKKSRQYGLE